MGALAISVHITGLDDSIAAMDTLATRLKEGMEPAMSEIGTLGSKYFGGVAFQSKGSAFGEPWEELAASTKAEKAKDWPGRPDMVRTTEMRNGFTFELLGPSTVRLYNAAPWFVYHQSSEERHKLPRRMMIGINTALMGIINAAVEKQVSVIIDEVTGA